MASVSGDGDNADVQEVVGVAEVFAEPLQRCLQQRLDPVDHHLVTLLLTCVDTDRARESVNNRQPAADYGQTVIMINTEITISHCFEGQKYKRIIKDYYMNSVFYLY